MYGIFTYIDPMKSNHSYTGWWFQPIWKIFVKWEIFPKFRDENSPKIFEERHHPGPPGKSTSSPHGIPTWDPRFLFTQAA